MLTFSPGSRISIQTGINPVLPDNIFTNIIEPTSNFIDIESVNYFNQFNGFFAIPTQTKLRLNQSTLSSAGNWISGTPYTAGQYVTQSAQIGAASDGNGFEWVCITPAASGSFISRNPPSLDVSNWRKMKYTYITSYTVKIATLLNDRIELVNTGLGYTPFRGYTKNHYRFTRDTSTSTLRRIWKGCKQTSATTFDGGPVVEIIPSSGDTLVVSTGAEPIQRKNDGSGPILDVR